MERIDERILPIQRSVVSASRISFFHSPLSSALLPIFSPHFELDPGGGLYLFGFEPTKIEMKARHIQTLSEILLNRG